MYASPDAPSVTTSNEVENNTIFTAPWDRECILENIFGSVSSVGMVVADSPGLQFSRIGFYVVSRR